MNRLVTNKMNYILDNWIPPVIRDSRWFYGIVLRIAVKKYAKYYMEFKEKVPFMSEQEINEYYRILAPSFINRKTDLSRKCIQRILSEINADDSVIDVAAGRGYLAGLVSGRTRNNVVAVDIVKPKSGANEACKYKFVEGTMTDLPFQDKSFDIVLCTHALEHIKDVKKAMSELRRVCRKKIIIVVPCQREYRFTADLHINFYRYEFDVRNCFRNDFEIDLVDGDWYCVANMNQCEPGLTLIEQVCFDRITLNAYQKLPYNRDFHVIKTWYSDDTLNSRKGFRCISHGWSIADSKSGDKYSYSI